MSQDIDKYKKNIINAEVDDEGESGQSGQAGQVEFKFFITSSLRDDQLSPQEIKRLLLANAQLHHELVKKQKEKRDLSAAYKEGKINSAEYKQQMGREASFKDHPILKRLSGTDQQEIPLPNENIAETNQEKRNELKYQHSLRFKPDNTPRFEPPKLKPS